MTDPLLAHLRTLTADDAAAFRPGQREAVEALVERRSRVLVVQRTGWGKSAVYFLATSLLREQGAGPTLLISPLLALMRNQLVAASRLGLRAATINSTNPGEHDEVLDRIEGDAVDLLLVSPERLANPTFREAWLPHLTRRPGLLVVDEVHCISDWGHDFRPDYRRIAAVLDRLPSGVPVLGCTATANDRVVADVVDQLGLDLEVFRGPLGREGLALEVIDLPAPAQRLAWLSSALPALPGAGIIYCLTIDDTRAVATYLRRQGHAVAAYSGDDDHDARVRAEEALLANEVKALVATSALGMGFDKPDLGFVVHYQSPGSPIAYYQQVGRAGRKLDESVGVLLRGSEDEGIQDWFIDTAFPAEADAAAVLERLEGVDGHLSTAAIEAGVNLRRSRLELLLKQLEVDGAVQRVTGGWQRTMRPWTYPAERVTAVTAARRAEQEEMRAYAATPGCRSTHLRALLDDPAAAEPCGICDRCAGPRWASVLDPAAVAAAAAFLRKRPLVVEPRKQWPSGVDEVRGRIPARELPAEGRALSRWGDGGWGPVVAKGRSEGALDPALAAAAAELVGEWAPDPAPEWVTCVASRRRPRLVADLAEALAAELGLPFVAAVARVDDGPPQRDAHNSAQQVRNLLGAFAIEGPVMDGPVLLVDDLCDSRWTLTVVAGMLRRAGAGPVLPLVLTKVGG